MRKRARERERESERKRERESETERESERETEGTGTSNVESISVPPERGQCVLSHVPPAFCHRFSPCPLENSGKFLTLFESPPPWDHAQMIGRQIICRIALTRALDPIRPFFLKILFEFCQFRLAVYSFQNSVLRILRIYRSKRCTACFFCSSADNRCP